ncbi:MAG TPA: 3'(2'),5'-bisphosphate nucleotidase CysQ [Gemmatimonadota bacterium]|nr:3'(2'),5'-bisphosphate nucleotidase CysQ [Gemmatimonadota bacterium]
MRRDAGGRAADLAVAVEAARAGGRAVMEWYGRDDLDVEDPTGRGPVTRADRAAHAAIGAVLAARAPGEAVRSEEAAVSGAVDAGRLWVVDPLDGTREFIDRIPEFCVMVGLAEAGRAVLGAFYQPVQNRLYAGIAAGGAWRIEGAESEPLSAFGPAPPRPRMVQSRSHPDPRLAALAAALGEPDVVVSGSVGSKCALLAEGRAELYVHPVPHLREWDTCAPEAVLRGAGGHVSDCAGHPLTYGKPDPAQPLGIFAARPGLADGVADAVLRFAPPRAG